MLLSSWTSRANWETVNSPKSIAKWGMDLLHLVQCFGALPFWVEIGTNFSKNMLVIAFAPSILRHFWGRFHNRNIWHSKNGKKIQWNLDFWMCFNGFFFIFFKATCIYSHLFSTFQIKSWRVCLSFGCKEFARKPLAFSVTSPLKITSMLPS